MQLDKRILISCSRSQQNRSLAKVRAVCDEAITKLEAGQSPAKVKAWAKSQDMA